MSPSEPGRAFENLRDREAAVTDPGGPSVTVLGAGAVGICSALWLQRAGARVTLIDRDPPASGCSAGNAGMLGTNSCVPLALPGVLRKVPALLRDPDAPLGLPLAQLPRLAPWLARFVLAARPARVEAIARALNRLQRELWPAYRTLLEDAGGLHFVRRAGKLHVCESEATLAGLRTALDLQRRNEVPLEILDGGEVRQMEPALAHSAQGGVFYPDVPHSLDPKGMLEALAARFEELGGRILREEVHRIATGPLRLMTAAGTREVGSLVLAAGAWSRDLARPLGLRIPLEPQRGYHVMLPRPGVALRLPFKSEDRKIIASPMEHGLRVTGIAEFGHLDDPPNPERAKTLLRAAQALLPGLVCDEPSIWMGARPCTPDSLPVIGRAPRHDRVVLAFGHGHLGLGLGAITGRLVSELVLDGRTSLDLDPFAPGRFALAA